MIRAVVLVALLASTCQVGPFHDPPAPDPGWPIEGPTLAAAGGSSSCAAAVENSKRLGCVFEADDAGGWCASLKPAQVACLASAKNCLATRQCTEVAK